MDSASPIPDGLILRGGVCVSEEFRNATKTLLQRLLQPYGHEN